MPGDIHTTMEEKNVPAANKKREVKGGSHKMPDGHMMKDSEMKERMEKIKKTRKSLKEKTY